MLACSKSCVPGFKNNQRDSKSILHFSDNQHISVFFNSYKMVFPYNFVLYKDGLKGDYCSKEKQLIFEFSHLKTEIELQPFILSLSFPSPSQLSTLKLLLCFSGRLLSGRQPFFFDYHCYILMYAHIYRYTHTNIYKTC